MTKSNNVLYVQMLEHETSGHLSFQFIFPDEAARNIEVYPVMDAWATMTDILQGAQLAGRPVHLDLRGHLGLSVSKAYTPPFNPKLMVRSVYRDWYTQAVQARAALLRQLVVCPPVR